MLLTSGILLAVPAPTASKELTYGCSNPPLEVTFAVEGGHYSGVVSGGNIFLQSDIPTAPVVRWKGARAGKLYTLMMLDFDGNANGSYPDAVAPGKNAPVRHWIAGNIPGALLASNGYAEGGNALGNEKVRVLQPYRSPHIPVVSDRYGLYLFEQVKEINFAELLGPITNFDHSTFLDNYRLGDPKAFNYFVAVYISESPFSGKAFHGNDVSAVWHQDLDKGKLVP